ncbi:MAG: molecular chaperone Hsp33, partial [Myxococcota bacterium]
MNNQLQRGVGHGSAIRFLAIQADEAVATAMQRHNLDEKGTIIIGEAMIAALMMSAYIKGEERITVQLQCDKPVLSVICDVDAEGNVRARLSPTHVRGDHATLTGVMLVIKHSATKELYRGATEIRGEGIPAALARHLSQSSQVDTVLRISVQVAPDGRVSAGGLLVERMPPVADLPSLSPAAFAETYGGLLQADPEALFAEIARGTLLGEDLMPAEVRPVAWRCKCSQPRVEGMLTALGVTELKSMLAEDDGATITCHFCNLQYTVNGQRLTALIKALIKALTPSES